MKSFDILTRQKIIIITLLLIVTSPLSLLAQKTVTISGEYTYIYSENVSLAEAKTTAVERAKIQALSEAFGTLIVQDNISMILNENEKSDVSFSSLGTSCIKGEWLKDEKIELSDPVYENGLYSISAFVKGKAREKKYADIDFSFKFLRNGITEEYESYEFKNGNNLYMSFSTPAKGYLAVYLMDESKTVYCLLPYQNDYDGQAEVLNNREYVFFSNEKAGKEDKNITDQYLLFTDNDKEINWIYVIFSPNQFIKANDKMSGVADVNSETLQLPRVLPFEDFQKWLSNNRLRDENMAVSVKPIVIKKKMSD